MNEDQRKQFGKRLARKRKQRSLTQEELAIKSGLDRVTINRIENGKFAVGLDILNKIAKGLQAQLDFIDIVTPWDSKFYDHDTKKEMTEEEYIKKYSGTNVGEKVRAEAGEILKAFLQITAEKEDK